jgi:hypothetical protein
LEILFDKFFINEDSEWKEDGPVKSNAPRAQRGASWEQTNTRETGGFVLPGW